MNDRPASLAIFAAILGMDAMMPNISPRLARQPSRSKMSGKDYSRRQKRAKISKASRKRNRAA